MLPRRFALLAAASLGAAAATAGACGDDEARTGPADDAGEPSGTLGSGVCPDAAPQAGAQCLLPEGTTCAFGACGTPIAECRGGSWQYGGNPPSRPLCPTLFPVPESPCPPCWAAEVVCAYGSCSGDGASTNTTIALCPNGTWQLAYFPCANLDAGADVQRDSRADAD